jgi:hypothetical protein
MMEITDPCNWINELAAIHWAFIQDLERVRQHRKRPVDKLLRVAHCLAQVSASYLKVIEAQAVYQEVPELRERLATLQAHQRNGHDPVTDRAPEA